jgi:hypothetical protein
MSPGRCTVVSGYERVEGSGLLGMAGPARSVGGRGTRGGVVSASNVLWGQVLVEHGSELSAQDGWLHAGATAAGTNLVLTGRVRSEGSWGRVDVLGQPRSSQRATPHVGVASCEPK